MPFGFHISPTIIVTMKYSHYLFLIHQKLKASCLNYLRKSQYCYQYYNCHPAQLKKYRMKHTLPINSLKLLYTSSLSADIQFLVPNVGFASHSTSFWFSGVFCWASRSLKYTKMKPLSPNVTLWFLEVWLRSLWDSLKVVFCFLL